MLRLVPVRRCSLSNVFCRFASSFQYVNIKNTDDGYSVIEMNRKPVNSFNLSFIQELTGAIDTVEKSNESRGLILTSSLKTFSAGLDLSELYNPDKERLDVFWSSFQELCLRLYSSPLVTIAAINGASPAGGCALSLCCDYRIMREGKFLIGLNETLVGLAAPFWLCRLFEITVGYRAAEKLLSLGTLCTPQEALNVGIIDQIASSEDLMDVAASEMKKWLSIPEMGRMKTKELMRMEFVKYFEGGRKKDLEDFVQLVSNPVIQKTLGKYLMALKK